MIALRRLLARLLSLVGLRRGDRDMDDEIQAHLDLAAARYMAQGLSRDDARFAALRDFGGVVQTKEAFRDARGLPVVDGLLQDARYAVRTLWKSPGFAAVAIVTLALGVGAATSIFSVVDAVLLRALPYPNPQQIVRIWEKAPDGHRMNLADPNFNDFRTENDTFAAMASYSEMRSSVSGGTEPARVHIAAVSSAFFTVLGVEPARGRAFAPDEQRLHGAPAAIVSDDYWRRYLAGAPDLSGLHVRFDGADFSIVGVMPQGFDFPAGVAVWIPRERYPDEPSRTGHNWRGIGRVRDGVAIAQARANLSAIARRIKDRFGKDADLADAAVVPLADALVGDVRTALLTLLGAVGLLLCVACANVAGLLLARTSARRKELAVRAALGAGRGRLVQQLLAESFVLALAGGALGILIAAWAVGVLPAILPPSLPRQQGIGIDMPVLLFALVAIILMALSLGLFAAWRAGTGDLQNALTSGSRGYAGGGATQRFRGVLVIGEIATTLVILIGTGLLGRSFLRLVSTSPGFQTQNLITVEFSLPGPSGQAGMNQAVVVRQVHLVDDLVARLRAIPGVAAVGLAGALPVAAGDNLADGNFLILDGRRPPADFSEFGRMARNPAQVGHAEYCVAGEAYFRTLGIPLVRGRIFGKDDEWHATHVAVISESLARRRWPNQDPIGRAIDFGNMDGNLKPLTIVGVVADVRASGLDMPPGPVVYVDYRQRGFNGNASPTILMRSAAPTRDVVSAARGIFRELAPDVPAKFSTFVDELGGWLAARRFLLLLVGVFAAVALILAAVGIYGVVAFSVARRTQEIGIRMALGAQRRGVLRLIVGEGARLAGAGVAIGVVVSLAVTRVVSSLLFEVSATDPLTFAGVSVLLMVVALAASAIPARHALRVDPMVAVRAE
jgi:putative ABC transport system permease protein